MITKHKPYQGNGPPGMEASNKGDPGVIVGSRGDPPLKINTGGNFTPLPCNRNNTIKPHFLVSCKEISGARNMDCPKKLNGRGMPGSLKFKVQSFKLR